MHSEYKYGCTSSVRICRTAIVRDTRTPMYSVCTAVYPIPAAAFGRYRLQNCPMRFTLHSMHIFRRIIEIKRAPIPINYSLYFF